MRRGSGVEIALVKGTEVPEFALQAERARLIEALRLSAFGAVKKVAGACGVPAGRIYQVCDDERTSYFEMADRWLVAARAAQPQQRALAPLIWLVERHLWRQPGQPASESLTHSLVMALLGLSCGVAQRLTQGGQELERSKRIEINQYLDQLEAALGEIRAAVNADPTPVVPLRTPRGASARRARVAG